MPGNKFAFHIVYIPFTGVGLYAGFRSQEWLEYRIKIFKEYTLKSLLNQTDKRFLTWLSFRPEEYNNPAVIELERYLQKFKDFPVIMTFHGLIYWDDKFPTKILPRIVNFLRICRNCLLREKTLRKLPGALLESLKNKNKDLRKNVQDSLAALQSVYPKKGIDVVFLTRIDSDDMFHKKAISDIKKLARKPALSFRKGYIYDRNTKQLAEWLPTENPPFHTIIFPVEVFFDADRYLEYMNGFETHEDIPKIFNTQRLPDYRYCVLIHSQKNQISTIWNHPFRGKIIKNKKILRDFGLEANSYEGKEE